MLFLKFVITIYFPNLCRFILYWTGSSASWTISIMSIERFIAIYFPIRTKNSDFKHESDIGQWLLHLSLPLPQIYIFSGPMKLNAADTVNTVVVSLSISVFLKEYWPWITMAVYSIIPFIILISTSTAIILKIIHSNYIRKHSMNIREGEIKNNEYDHHFALRFFRIFDCDCTCGNFQVGYNFNIFILLPIWGQPIKKHINDLHKQPARGSGHTNATLCF